MRTAIPANSPEYFVKFTNWGSFYDFVNLAGFPKISFGHYWKKCIPKPNRVDTGACPFVPVQETICQRGTCFKQVYQDKFLKQAKSAKAVTETAIAIFYYYCKFAAVFVCCV